VYSERVYGIPPEQVVGSAGGTSYRTCAKLEPARCPLRQATVSKGEVNDTYTAIVSTF
jgi:hypothetical protein